jgi:hypothetical protein
MSQNGGRGRQLVADAAAARRRAQVLSGLRGLARPGGVGARAEPVERSMATTSDEELCDLCGVTIPAEHRHLLHVGERRIVCACEACWAMRSGEGDYRPTGHRTVWLSDLQIPDELWAAFQIPIGLAFFMRSTVTECVVAMYPSPAGATESELHFDAWDRMLSLNPVLRNLEPDIEGLVVNRLSDTPAYAIAPIDRCYALTGAIKASWEGISGGSGVESAVEEFFRGLRTKAVQGARA